MKRYIEVGEFFKRFNFLTADSDDPRDNYYYQSALNDVFWEFEFTPTADVQEVKHGRWVHDGCDFPHGNDWIHCSVCGKRGINVPADLTPYCPNCGAKMDEVEQDG